MTDLETVGHVQRRVATLSRPLRVVVLLTFAALVAGVGAAIDESSPKTGEKVAIFAGGCFWCIQPAFDKAPGVHRTMVGYCGGTEPNPTYDLVTTEKTKYRESIEIFYDPTKITYAQLLDIYWKEIDPTQSDGQFADIGPSYRAAIFVADDNERKTAEESKTKLAQSN